MPAIKVLAIDDHPLYVQGFSACLREMPLVAHVDTCQAYDELNHKLSTNQPHLVFLELNLNLNRYDGFELCSRITGGYRNVFVAVLSRYNDEHLIQQARSCGARAYFDKSTPAEVFYAFIDDFARGNISRFYIHVAAKRNPNPLFVADGFELKCLLTKREIEVMKMIVDGKEHGEIEAELFISYNTYKSHHAHILQKLCLRNDVELTKFAIRHNLCSVEGEQGPLQLKIAS